ncbi:MAG: aminotransferase class I/II-fold pyridoxal phosphate-dependent enzyme [Eubacterium sp.]|nr:aminotransferase class I/II-fold pyridoxal phosphate-dependent enzyme [Eubacterium sp.]
MYRFLDSDMEGKQENKVKMKKQMNQLDEYDNLYERLSAYARTDVYPFHMPGHKRADLNFTNPYKIDLTEIDGFDNLHFAEDILLKAQKKLEKIYHSRKSYYLINGSTCGILSAIGTLTKPEDHVLIARNCHKSVYNAVKLFHLKADYVYPKIMNCGIQGNIEPEQLEQILEKQKNIRLVVITSPTYDGIVSDIRKIADITHKYHAYLIVDEAHGAHFSLSEYFPESAVSQNADLVIHSLHKTLPGFTQTAALHVTSNRIDEKQYEQLEEMLRIFQSSSPSYLLMAGIDRCVDMIERSGSQLFEKYQKNLIRYYKACEKLIHLHVLTEKDYEEYQIPAADHGKILIRTDSTSLDGRQLYHLLADSYHLQMEMYSARYVLAMTSIMDTQEGFDRLFWALLEIDRQLDEDDQEQTAQTEHFLEKVYGVREKVLEISDIVHYNIEETDLHCCAGKICAEYIYLYPPGIPMIVPGEKLTDEFVKTLEKCCQMRLQLAGMKDRTCRKILTVACESMDRL